MKLAEIMRVECLAAHQEIPDKESALRAVARLAKNHPALEGVSEDEVYGGLAGREELGSTGFGDGIAIPHCRLEKVNDFAVGLITVPAGVDFEALDGEKVHLLVFIVGPAGESHDYIRVLSAISHTLGIPGAVAEIVAEPTPEAALESFLRHVQDEVDTHDHGSKNLFHLFIQNEELFQDLLQLFTGVESSGVMVIEAQNAAAYLTKLPLFTGLLSDKHLGFSRIIVAAVERKLSNEMIRQIERVTGKLDTREDIMLTVQQVFYTAGALGD